MPHIVVETAPRFATILDFVALFSVIHQRIADSGHAALNDFKSRVHITDRHLAGREADGEFVVARLVTTNPRPRAMQRAIAEVIHDTLRDAIESEPRPFWWQCCVPIEPFDKEAYLKTDSRGSETRLPPREDKRDA
jgi:5-carboxymethyl-2-hydroxymuconate isomerase